MTSSMLRCVQVWGCNTGVGKTIASGALAAHSGGSFGALHYCKPVQTGYPEDDDSNLVSKLARRSDITTRVMVAYRPPVSPHRAWEKAPISDASLVQRLREELEQCKGRAVVVETAGGVLSPAPSGTVQADAYRPLRLPSLLVGEGRLGGISATLSAYESLAIRGYDIPYILIFGTEHENHIAIAQNVDAKVFAAPEIPPMPEPLDPFVHNNTALGDVFQELSSDLATWWQAREDRLKNITDEAKSRVWWPFTQHAKLPEITVIDSAHRDDLTIARHNSKEETLSLEDQFDGCSSWWTVGLGHGNPQLALTAARAAGRYGHVIFPETIHEPVMDLTNMLVEGIGREWAQRVFYSDNGSTAVEVALKMALRKRALTLTGKIDQYPWQEDVKVISFEGSYHGDTLGVMNCCPKSAFNSLQFPWYQPRGLFFDPPTMYVSNGAWRISCRPEESFESRDQVFDITARLATPSAKQYRAEIRTALDAENGTAADTIGALLMEPVVQGAGGMRLIDPLYQHIMASECRQRGIPIIMDEVFTGFWRLGAPSGADLLGIKPDIAAYGKLLTGGILPLSVTLASEDVFDAFQGETKREALLHGHSYTAHPIGCLVACESLKTYEKHIASIADRQRTGVRSYWDPQVTDRLSQLESIAGVVNMGTILALHLRTEGSGYAATGSVELARHLRREGSVFARPLGNTLYVMCSPITPMDRLRPILRNLEDAVLAMEHRQARRGQQAPLPPSERDERVRPMAAKQSDLQSGSQ